MSRPGLFTAAEVAQAVTGELLAAGGQPIRTVSVDSRRLPAGTEAGALFVALPGSRVDGHEFVGDAVHRGAAAVILSRRWWSAQAPSLRSGLSASGAALVAVQDTLAALQTLAAMYLRRFPGLLRVGVTGSNGKTTTKEILGSILTQESPTVVSEGNLNSEIGLPLSAFRVRGEHRYAVFEMGINHPGEMAVLAGILRPDAAVITNVGSAHVGLLGSRQAIAREKREIFRYFDGGQTAFLHESADFLPLLTEGLRGKKVLFGSETTRGFEGSEDLGLDGCAIHWEGLRIRFPLFGKHNLNNALAAISVSAELGISKEKIKRGLESVRPLFGRSEVWRGPLTVLQDCYNANPDSLRQLLEFLEALPWPGRKVAVLGSMKELGAESEEAHRGVGRLAGEANLQGLFLFGEEMAAALTGAQEGGFSGLLEWTADFGELRDRLKAYVRPGDLILIKGSRAVELERLAPELAETVSAACGGL
jgi:UDP-N-acetylmuramoyl-tripeptide--D-alanyl-D-alanine ligase